MPRAVVTGGAGFVGSHLCDRLLREGWDVICVDSFLTGSEANIESCRKSDHFRLLRADVTLQLAVEESVDWVFHLASSASPVDYADHPIETLEVGSLGTSSALALSRAKGASFLLASTSEVYGDPKVHPQPESYWGNVNPTGPRSVYDEAKRFAEALTMAHHRVYDIPAHIARIFNTYGPRMRQRDGRAVPTFIRQALSGEPITVQGDGTQTRSLCYVDDLVEGLWGFVGVDPAGPVNLGNPEEITILELADRIRNLTGSGSQVEFVDPAVDDPQVRCPDISRAREMLSWEPTVPLDEGLRRTIRWAREAWGPTRADAVGRTEPLSQL